jgi:hypothetical protein
LNGIKPVVIRQEKMQNRIQFICANSAFLIAFGELFPFFFLSRFDKLTLLPVTYSMRTINGIDKTVILRYNKNTNRLQNNRQGENL